MTEARENINYLIHELKFETEHAEKMIEKASSKYRKNDMIKYRSKVAKCHKKCLKIVDYMDDFMAGINSMIINDTVDIAAAEIIYEQMEIYCYNLMCDEVEKSRIKDVHYEKI